MRTIVFTGMSEMDLNRQQWDWQTSSVKKTVVKQWPDELLPMTMRSPGPMRKILPTADQLSRRVDYEEE